MSAFYFGSSEVPLFGFYHSPTGRPARRAGVVLCNPMGQEYLRSHRSLKGLAERLSNVGHHVLRFDYRSTGDSAGEGDDLDLKGWVDDTAQAAEELKAISGVRRISLIGVRLGCVVAALAAAARDDLDDMVFWDPVVDGEDYLNALLEGHHHPADPPPGYGAEAFPPAPGGFPLPAAFRREVAEVDLTRLDDLPVRRALLVSSAERSEYGALEDHLRTLVPEVVREHRPGAEGWDNPGRMGSLVLVPAVAGTITGFFEAST